MAVNIVVACGSGIATSTVVELRLREIVEEAKIEADIKKVTINDLEGLVWDADLIVVTSKYTSDNLKIKVLSGTSLLTGIGEESFIETFVDSIKEIEKNKKI